MIAELLQIVLYAAGILLMAAGAFMVYPPFGLMLAGLCLAGSVWRYAAASETVVELGPEQGPE